MRLWSIHPKYLDSKGLVALWREALLAQHVLLGKTKAYKNHPQLLRFKQTSDPIIAISQYLLGVAVQADARGYNFNKDKIYSKQSAKKMSVNHKQLGYEFNHLLGKLKIRDSKLFEKFQSIKSIEAHNMFYEVEGSIEDWEIQKTGKKC